jgi:ubiquitin carboxyl-terminal hydrolase 25
MGLVRTSSCSAAQLEFDRFDLGKLAPTLIQDLYLFDPRCPLSTGLNVLRDVPLSLAGYSSISDLLSEGSCRHAWCTKDKQSVLPALDARPGPDTTYKFAGFCRKCRMRLEVEVNYIAKWGLEPCPNSTHPLHHLVHSPWQESLIKRDSLLGSAAPNFEAFVFQCSSPTCSATVIVRLRSPVLSDDHIRLLTDKALLNQRAEEVIGSEPTRFEGHKKPTAVDVLSDLRSYLKNSFEQHEPRPIKTDNKRFPLRFGLNGQACQDVLNFLGFKYEVRCLLWSLSPSVG